VVFGLVSRLFSALLPVGLLWITKLIIDSINTAVHTPPAGEARILVAGGRRIFAGCPKQHPPANDRLLRSLWRKYTRHVSIRVMNQAASLDLIAYEDPVFYDRLERARCRQRTGW